MKSVPENIQLSEDLSHQFPWIAELLTVHPEFPSEGVEGWHLKQHRVQVANALGKRQFVVDNVLLVVLC